MYQIHRHYEHNFDIPPIIINATGHVAGKLATHVAKRILEGVPCTVVHTENLILTGPIERSVGRFKSYLNKRQLTKPSKGPFHQRSPSEFFKRIVRRMVPKKKVKGQKALDLLKVYESCPEELTTAKFLVCPKALKKYTTDPVRKFFHLKELLVKFGWKNSDIVEEQNIEINNIRTKIKEKKVLREDKEKEVRTSEKFKRRVEEFMSQIE